MKIAGAFRLKLLVGGLGVSMFIAGCAFTTGHVNLDYQPQTDVTKVAQTNSPNVAVLVKDVRATQVVGRKKNGFGMKTADIVSDNDVSGILKSAFETELTDRGFRVGSGGNLVAIDLDNLTNEFSVGWFSGDSKADLGMDVTVKHPDGKVAYNRYVVGKGQEWIQMMTPGNAETTLNGAIKDGVATVFGDTKFIDALKHH